MLKFRATKQQLIASVLIAVLAVAMIGVGLYGLSARSSQSGLKLLEDMRLQAILNTAGVGAVEAYVDAERQAATQAVREAGGGMAEIREASAKAAEEAAARAEEMGIGAVDLSEIDTTPLGEALNELAAAQQAYYAEEAAAQALYIEEHADEAAQAAVDEAAADRAG